MEEKKNQKMTTGGKIMLILLILACAGYCVYRYTNIFVEPQTGSPYIGKWKYVGEMIQGDLCIDGHIDDYESLGMTSDWQSEVQHSNTDPEALANSMTENYVRLYEDGSAEYGMISIDGSNTEVWECTWKETENGIKLTTRQGLTTFVLTKKTITAKTYSGYEIKDREVLFLEEEGHEWCYFKQSSGE